MRIERANHRKGRYDEYHMVYYLVRFDHIDRFRRWTDMIRSGVWNRDAWLMYEPIHSLISNLARKKGLPLFFLFCRFYIFGYLSVLLGELNSNHFATEQQLVLFVKEGTS